MYVTTMLYISPDKVRMNKNCIIFTNSEEMACNIPYIHVIALVSMPNKSGETILVILLKNGSEIKVNTDNIHESDKESWDAYKKFVELWHNQFETKKEPPSLNQF